MSWRTVIGHPVLRYSIALDWLVNGVWCKVLSQVPRHEAIVAAILGGSYARGFTLAIGLAELVMAFWIISGWKSRLNAYAQIMVIITMNIMEFLLVPDLLLWGHWNMVFAVGFCSIIFLNDRYRTVHDHA